MRALCLLSAELLIVGCTAAQPPRTPSAADGGAASPHLLSGEYIATDQDLKHGPTTPGEQREAAAAYYREREQELPVTPPPVAARRTIGDHELLWMGVPKGQDRELVYDRRSGRIVGTFHGHIPGGAVQPAPQASPEPLEEPAEANEYAFSRENPVMLGLPGDFMGPAAQRMYLSALRDSEGRPYRFNRRGSVGAGPDGHMLDAYELVSEDGQGFVLYLDMYHPERHPLDQPPPRGMRLVRDDK